MACAALTGGKTERGARQVQQTLLLDLDPFPRPSFGEGRPAPRSPGVPEVDTTSPGTNVPALMAAMRTGRVG